MKRYSSNDKLVHAFVNRLSSDGTANNLFFEGNKLYSYGYHYQLAEYDAEKKVLFINSSSTSVTTAKHRSLLVRAYNGNVLINQVFYVDFSSTSNRFYEENIADYADFLYTEAVSSLKSQIRAKSSTWHEENAYRIYNGYMALICIYSIEYKPLPEDLKDQANIRAEYIRETEQDRINKRAEREKNKLQNEVEKFLKFEKRSISTHHEFVYLRINDKGVLETSKGVCVPMGMALALYNMFKSGAPIVGEKVCGFNVDKVTDDYVQIGCHKIKIAHAKEVFNS